jgi:hypothetical protein
MQNADLVGKAVVKSVFSREKVRLWVFHVASPTTGNFFGPGFFGPKKSFFSA